MSLRDVVIKNEYRSLLDDIAKEFYIPLLSQACSYKRAVGFFSSSALVEVSKGIASLVANGGKIQLVASPFLSDEDVEAIRRGYEQREKLIAKSLLKELHDAPDDFSKNRLNLLANLISDDILDIRIALTEHNGVYGMYHEKMGIIADKESNKVAFSGSMNESATAFKSNYEAIDVFCSWDDIQQRVVNKENAFEAIWNGIEPNIETIDFRELKDEIIQKYKTSSLNLETAIANEKEYFATSFSKEKKVQGITLPENFSLHDYQLNAIDEWKNNNYCGIFDMATGTGKTFTGLGAAARLSSMLAHKLAIFIVCPYQHLVEQWVEDIKFFGVQPIIGYSASPQKNWKQCLENAILDQKLKRQTKQFFCFVTTNATFASSFVQSQIAKIKSDTLIIVDEAHNFGADNLSKTLTDNFKYRLALSATLNRHNDEEGTAKLLNYFGEKCVEYTLEKAIEEKKLTRYKYYPILCTLSCLELENYAKLTDELTKCLIKGKDGKIALSEKGKKIALKRARLVAGAQDKITKLEEYILPYKNDQHILVYCGATKLLETNQESSDVDKDDLRQIDVVTNLLGNKLEMKVSQFTSKEDMDERSVLKKEFSEGYNLQALIAIKCLDEGVNIPKIKTAFILASTTNPKEYIQRRGRVLRLSKGKDYAKIYDFVILPRPLNSVHSLTKEQMQKDISLVKNELSRIEEFARLSMNQALGQTFIDDIKGIYSITDHNFTFTEDYFHA